MPTKHGHFELIAFQEKRIRQMNILALKKGEWQKDEPVLVSVHHLVLPVIFSIH